MSDKRKVELDVDLINRIVLQLEDDIAATTREIKALQVQYNKALIKRAKAVTYLRQLRGVSEVEPVLWKSYELPPLGLYPYDDLKNNEQAENSRPQAGYYQMHATSSGEKVENLMSSEKISLTENIEKGIIKPELAEGNSLNEIEQNSGEIKRSKREKLAFYEVEGFQWRKFLPELIKIENRFMDINDIFNALKISKLQRKKVYSTVSSALSVLAKNKTKLISLTIPDVKKQLYGLPNFFEPETGKVKIQYVDDLLKKRMGEDFFDKF